MNTLVFDIETVPDVALGRRLYGLEGLADEQVAQGDVRAAPPGITGRDFLPLEQQRVVAISCALRNGEDFTVWSLGDAGSSEAELVQRFFDGIEKFSPDLVSWNGSGFDLPVLTYRALLAGVQAPRFWETGEADTEFRYNNYLNRYHWRHTDLMDVLSGFQSRGRVSLANMACLLGLPGKLGFDGGQVWDAWQAGEIGRHPPLLRDRRAQHLADLPALRSSCAGSSRRAQHAEELERVRAFLRASKEPHFAEFLRAWQGGA